jgi:hypothetical protein
MKAEIAAMPIKLSAKDKNLVALFWLLEIVLTAIVSMDDEHKPERKKAMYEQITSGLLGDSITRSIRFLVTLSKTSLPTPVSRW